MSLSPAPLVKTFSYSAIGNILSKSDVGNYGYAPSGSPRPHAVVSTSGGAFSTTFTYDPNGNQTAGLGRTVTYTSYNKPASITQGARTISFVDDTEHQRFKQVTPEGTTLYIAGFGVLAEISNPGTASAKWTEYLSVGNAKVGMRTLQVATATLTTRYFHTDHLGSISVVTNEFGVVVERLSYDAWGKRRNPNGTDDVTGSITSQTNRGFTGHEELDSVGLVHMNGRVYDPLLARFTSADPVTESPFSTQGWNRYSYVGNDPLAFTDPSGHCFLGCFWQHSIFRAVVQIAITAILTPFLGPVAAGIGLAGNAALAAAGAAAAFAGAAIVTGLSGGNLGQSLKAGVIAGVTALAFAGVAGITGHTPQFGTPEYVGNVAGHALVGCASSAASGGSCQSGALAAAAGAAGAPFMSGMNYTQGVVASAVLGGVGSVAGGGKFANGAVTGAFGYMFNNCFDCLQRRNSDPRLSGRADDTISPLDLLNFRGWGTAIAAGFRAALEGEAGLAARGLYGGGKFGGTFSPSTNAAGGQVWTSVGDIGQSDFAGIVNGGLMKGEVNILTGVHGFPNGGTVADLGLYSADVAKFGGYPGVNVYNIPGMTSGQISNVLNGPGTTIGAFCNSGACLAPFR